MKKLFCFILLLVALRNTTVSQSDLDGTYNLFSEDNQEFLDEYVFLNDSLFKFKRLKYHENECGMGRYTIDDTLLTLIFQNVPTAIKDSLRSYYVVQDSTASQTDISEYIIRVVDHDDMPLLGTSAQLIDSLGYTITDKIEKSWEVDSDGNAVVSIPSDVSVFGIKIANMGYETLVIPVELNVKENLTVKMLELEKCSHVFETGTVKKYYLKNVRHSGFYLREENSDDYKYFKKERN